ncbi:MAG: hypothetical protein VYD64_09875 [Pseudomonadota bacterium]|nr:hypothetical protein [Pseudomonadota bacterium]
MKSGNLFALALAWALSTLPVGALSAPLSYQVTCTVNAGSMSGQRYAVLKCHEKSKPGRHIIRNQVWERDNQKGYASLARSSGRRFTCDVSRAGSGMEADSVHNVYDLKNCH